MAGTFIIPLDLSGPYEYDNEGWVSIKAQTSVTN
jgi:hypothetical protein